MQLLISLVLMSYYDRPMNEDKNIVMEDLSCNLVLMESSGGEVIGLNQTMGEVEELQGEDLTEIPSCVVSTDISGQNGWQYLWT